MFKIYPKALISLKDSSVDVFPFLVFFILLFFGVIAFSSGKKVTLLRRASQLVSFFCFVFLTQECFCFIRNAFLYGIPFIGKDELLSFGYLVLSVFIVCFTLVFGRFFCGWVCPLGFIQEIAGTIGNFFLWYRKVYNTFLTTENNLKLLPKVIFLKQVKRKIRIFFLFSLLGAGIFYIVRFKPSQDMLLQFIPAFLVLIMFIILIIYCLKPQLEAKLAKTKLVIAFIWLGLILARVYTFQPWCYLQGGETGDYGIRFSMFSILLVSLLFFRPFCRFSCPVGGWLYLLARRSLITLKKKNPQSQEHKEDVCPVGAIGGGELKNRGECIRCGECVARAGFTISLD